MIFLTQSIENAIITLTSGIESIPYYLNNLTSRNKNKLFKTSLYSSEDIIINIDLGSPRSCNCFGFGNKSMNALCEVRIYVGTEDNGTDFDITLPGYTNKFYYKNGNEIKFTDPSYNKRYWKIDLDFFAKNGVDYFGLLFLGNYHEFPVMPEYNYDKGNNYMNISNSNILNYDVNVNIGNPYSYYNNLLFQNLSLIQVQAFETEMNINNAGLYKPFFFSEILYDGWIYRKIYYGYLIDYNFTKLMGDKYNLTLNLISEDLFNVAWIQN